MTLFKQTAAVLMLLMVAIFVTVLMLNFASASSAAEDELYQDAKNTATSLSLSLATTGGDTVMMKTMIEANFDSGRYHQIRLIDVDNNTICHQIMPSESVSVPAWFLTLINIEAPIASANVFTGWKQIGILQVQSDSSRMQARLYEIFKNLMLSFGFILLFGFATLYGLFLIVLRPLGKIREQAESIISNEFIIQEKIPRTTEFRGVVSAMNQMVLRLKNIFNEASREMQRQKESAYLDPLTQIKNRKFLTEHFTDYFTKETNSYEGTVLLLELNGVDVLQIGYKAMETLFVKTAAILTQATAGFENRLLVRLNETEFFLFLPGILGEDAIATAQTVFDAVEKEIAALGIDKTQTNCVIGLYENSDRCTLSELLVRADSVLAKAKFNYRPVCFNPLANGSKILGKDAWRHLINRAIEESAFDFTLHEVMDSKTGTRRYYAVDVVLQAEDGSAYSYDHFIPPAAQIGLGARIHQKTMRMLFEKPPHALKGHTCSFKISMHSLEQQEMYETLEALFEKYMADLPFTMIIEISDRAAAKNLLKILPYKRLFERFGIGIALFDFIGENEDHHYLEKLHPVYIKGDMNYFLSQDNQSLSTLRLLTESIGSTIIANNVTDEEAVRKLHEKGIFLTEGERVLTRTSE